jgi:hypothetical protein
MSIAKKCGVLTSIIFACFLFCAVQAKEDRLHDCPELMLWAWERPEIMQWINPGKVGVAFLACTIDLNENSVVLTPRRQPLVVPPGTYMMAVVRLESDPLHPPKFLDSQVESVVRAILAVGGPDSIRALQIDFDARENERISYAKILQKVRKDLPDPVALSMTALASWCSGDRWLEQLPVDEVVPMYFRMGAVGSSREQYLSSMKEYFSSDIRQNLSRHHQRCTHVVSIGVATDEYIAPRFTAGRRVYVFSPKAWTKPQTVSAVDISRFK